MIAIDKNEGFSFDRKNRGFRCILTMGALRQGEAFAAVFLDVINLAECKHGIDQRVFVEL